MSLEECINEYLSKTGKLHIDGEIIYEEAKGFMTYQVLGELFIIPDVFGDGKYWLSIAIEMAKANNCTRLRGGTTRNVKAYNKFFGTKIVGYILEKEI